MSIFNQTIKVFPNYRWQRNPLKGSLWSTTPIRFRAFGDHLSDNCVGVTPCRLSFSFWIHFLQQKWEPVSLTGHSCVKCGFPFLRAQRITGLRVKRSQDTHIGPRVEGSVIIWSEMPRQADGHSDNALQLIILVWHNEISFLVGLVCHDSVQMVGYQCQWALFPHWLIQKNFPLCS